MHDILIRGVRFPKDNPVSFTLYPEGTVSWREYHEFAKHGNVTNGALIVQFPRAIELPPHGDLIDRAPLVQTFNERAGKEGWAYLDDEDLDDAPVIVPASEEVE